eukprot:scaffold26075_cov69-Phaeocystis_antarctica.AAC.1
MHGGADAPHRVVHGRRVDRLRSEITQDLHLVVVQEEPANGRTQRRGGEEAGEPNTVEDPETERSPVRWSHTEAAAAKASAVRAPRTLLKPCGFGFGGGGGGGGGGGVSRGMNSKRVL